MDRSNDLEFMKEYLFNAMTFEKYVYTWSNALSSANNVVSKVQNDKASYLEKLEKTKSELESLDETYSKGRKGFISGKRFGRILWLIVFGVLAIIISVVIMKNKLDYLALIPELVIIPGIIAYILTKKESGEKEYTDEEKRASYRNLTAWIKEYETESIPYINSKFSLVTEEQARVEKNLNDAQSTLSEIYSENVLPECYRNFVAVATMYQYIVTGRCVCVKGHGGIYDTYEHDFRMNLIITNLQRINEKLDEIIENQNMLYRQMVEVNENLNSINKELKNIGEKTSNIERSSAMSALAQHQAVAIMNYNASKHW